MGTRNRCYGDLLNWDQYVVPGTICLNELPAIGAIYFSNNMRNQRLWIAFVVVVPVDEHPGFIKTLPTSMVCQRSLFRCAFSILMEEQEVGFSECVALVVLLEVVNDWACKLGGVTRHGREILSSICIGGLLFVGTRALG